MRGRVIISAIMRRELAPDEKAVTVMVYTRTMLARGEIIIQENLRASIWLRTQGVPSHIHLFSSDAVVFGGTPPQSMTFSELFVPAADVIAFHLAPPAQDPLDYEPNETNRIMVPVKTLIGSFVLNGKLRISTQTDLATTLDAAHGAWTSVYEATITNPYLPKFTTQTPMVLVSPSHVSFGLA
jgi:hypothetical protein